MTNIILCLVAGFIAGFLSVYFFYKKKTEKTISSLHELDKQKSVNDTTLQRVQHEYSRLENQLLKEREFSGVQSKTIAILENENKHLNEKLSTQKEEIKELQERLTTEFENIANKILKERANEFSTQNQKNISEILDPLKEKISSFEKKVEETYDKELRDKLSLKEEVKRLTELNTRVSEDANNLTKALKGDIKKQGNWGEIILERVLECSGLTKGQEYEREKTIQSDNNLTQRPDVIIYLPDNKHIIIDSKVSLVAYDRYVNALDETERDKFLKEHIRSLREHIKSLSEKKYHCSPTLNTPDFVLMFVPMEASFSAAVQTDANLFSFAWERKIVIVSPTTLLATLRTISSIWRQENQTKYAREIAQLSGKLYDKLVGFTEDLYKIKENIDKANKSYDEALKKMQTGNGNIFRTAEKIKKLGAAVTKSLPDNTTK